MKAFLQISFLFLAFVLSLVPGRSLFAIPGETAHATTNHVISGAQPPAPAAPIPPELRNEGDPDLLVKGSPLPLVSFIGFALLIGSIIPAMRARKATGTHP